MTNFVRIHSNWLGRNRSHLDYRRNRDRHRPRQLLARRRVRHPVGEAVRTVEVRRRRVMGVAVRIHRHRAVARIRRLGIAQDTADVVPSLPATLAFRTMSSFVENVSSAAVRSVTAATVIDTDRVSSSPDAASVTL